MNKKFDTFYKLTMMVSIIIIIIILYRCCGGIADAEIIDVDTAEESVILIEPENCTIENAPIYSKDPDPEELEYMIAFSDCYNTLNLPYSNSDVVVVPEPKTIYLFIIILVFIIGMAIRFKK
jgi:hypothetical protein